MPLLFDHLNAQCEGTIAVNRQARIVWINDKYAEKVGIRDPSSVLGKEIGKCCRPAACARWWKAASRACST